MVREQTYRTITGEMSHAITELNFENLRSNLIFFNSVKNLQHDIKKQSLENIS